MLLSSNPTIAAALRFLFPSVHWTPSCLNSATCASLYISGISITMVRQIRTSISCTLTTKGWAGFRQHYTCFFRKAHFIVPVWLIGPDFNALVTPNMIQSVTMWARSGWRKETTKNWVCIRLKNIL
jgi:hypothetical protein